MMALLCFFLGSIRQSAGQGFLLIPSIARQYFGLALLPLSNKTGAGITVAIIIYGGDFNARFYHSMEDPKELKDLKDAKATADKK